ncbi:hypothetical protein SAMN05660206_10436 [Sphingobacterium wenxiniae]|uniref:Uncharacterized protein n=1 Tax=Sphingobacterium wenxiniae TaxID=683125 RepID=A0A1I6RZH7_9SPHI|nr:hypothetical protein SAMN05660206_10436 [Sphingobacterium wenxiniae]
MEVMGVMDEDNQDMKSHKDLKVWQESMILVK